MPGAPFRLPPRFEGLRRLAHNLWWTWHPRAALLFQRIDATTWSRYRNPIALFESPISWQPLLDDPAFIAEYEDVLAELDRYMDNGSDHWFQRAHARPAGRPDRVLLRRVRPPRVARDLLRRPGRPRRRPHEERQRHGPPVRGRGAALPQGLLPAVDRRGRAPGARLPRLRPRPPPGAPGPRPDGRPPLRPRGAARPHRPRRRLDAPGGPCAGSPARHRPRAQRRARPADHPHPLRPRPRDAAPPGAGPGRRRRARPPGPRTLPRRSGTSTRATPRSCSWSAPARWSARARPSPTPGRPSERTSAFTIHTPVSAGNERFDAGLVRRVAGPLFAAEGQPGTASIPVDDVLALGRGLDDDPNQFDMTAFSLRLANGANAVSKLHGETANDTWQHLLGGRTIHGVTNGIHPPTWVGRAMRELYQRFLDADLDDLDGQSDAGRFWERVGRIPDRELWEAHLHQKRELAVFARERLRGPAGPPRRVAGDAHRGRDGRSTPRPSPSASHAASPPTSARRSSSPTSPGSPASCTTPTARSS